MKLVYKLVLLALGFFFVIAYSEFGGGRYLGYAGSFGSTDPSGSNGAQSSQPVIPAKATVVYYETTIKDIISADCGRCHSGPTRNLMDYDSLKMYADSGLLSTMVQGPMRRFAGNDTQTIVTWAQNGAPEKPAATRAAFHTGNVVPSELPPCATPIQGGDRITYTNGIRQVLAKDCLRCHSDPFRNLTTYENVKLYVDNGLLKKLVRLGGPMHRFAGPDSRLIITWIDNGAPQ